MGPLRRILPQRVIMVLIYPDFGSREDFRSLVVHGAHKQCNSLACFSRARKSGCTIDKLPRAANYSTYLGGNAEDYESAIVVDGLVGTYVIGFTFSTNLPTITFPHVGGSGCRMPS